MSTGQGLKREYTRKVLWEEFRFPFETQNSQWFWPLEETASDGCSTHPGYWDKVNPTDKPYLENRKSSPSLLIFLIHSSTVSVDSTWKPTVTVLYFFLTLCILLNTSTSDRTVTSNTVQFSVNVVTIRRIIVPEKTNRET